VIQARRKRPFSDRKLIVTGLREILFISFCFVSLYLIISLFTYYPLDPGLFHDNSDIQEIHNKGGLAGALLADLFFNLFGYFAYLFAYMIGHVGWLIYKGRHEEILAEPKELIIPGIGFILTLSAGCGLAIVHFAAESALLPSHAGGVLGNLVGKNLESLFSPLGATLLLLAVFFTGITMLTDLSWLKLMDFLGYHTLRLTPVVQHYLRHRLLPWSADKCRYAFNATKHGSHKTAIGIAALSRQGWDKTCALSSELKQSIQERRAQRQAAAQARQAAAESAAAAIEEKAVATPVVVEAMPPEDDVDYQVLSLPNAQPEEAQEHDNLPLEQEDFNDTWYLPDPALLAQADTRNQEKPDIKPIFMRVQVALHKIKEAAKVKGVYPGPLVSRVEIQPACEQGGEVADLSAQLLEQLAIPGVRVLEATPAMLSLEIPNAQPHAVYLRELISSDTFQYSDSPLPIALGKDVVGHPAVVDLARMPHLLIAGSNGTDINRALHGILLSLLYRASPREVRLLLLDSAHKVLTLYNHLPHLLAPVSRELVQVIQAFHWCSEEVERRYRMMAELGVRNIEAYNRKVTEPEETAEGFSVDAPHLPYIVIVVHELAEIFAEKQGCEVEELIIRLAQKARAAGVHMLIASQEPSVHVLTGVIKNNFPTRMVFQTATKNESRIALGQHGAESLLGNGDMFFLTPGTGTPARIHGAQISADEVKKVVEGLCRQHPPRYQNLAPEHV
jgi:DNA segregation ATPase FtsK/SpoIIIE, S-DNA-T family